MAKDLHLSDSECEAEQSKPKSKKHSRCDPSTSKKTSELSTAPPPKKIRINPIKKPTPSSAELFGSDSSEEDTVSAAGSKKGTALYSYITRKLANGMSRQTDDTKTGTHYVELKIYACDEIKNVTPINRWRHSVITIKNRTNVDTEAWSHLTDFVKATRKEYKHCPVSFNSSYF